MNARNFFKIYTDTLNKQVKELLPTYKNDKEFTPIIKKIINKIITDCGYNAQNEYFRIDCVGWISRYENMKSDAKAKNIKLNAHLWDLKIAIEHENSKRDWTDEVIKLIHIKCPLKVVICYNYCNEREAEEYKKLQFVADWMKEIEAINNGIDEEYLIIIGNGCNSRTGKSDYIDFGYKGYIYDHQNNKFTLI